MKTETKKQRRDEKKGGEGCRKGKQGKMEENMEDEFISKGWKGGWGGG